MTLKTPTNGSGETLTLFCRRGDETPAYLERFPAWLNRKGFPNGVKSDSSFVLDQEAGMDGEGTFG